MFEIVINAALIKWSQWAFDCVGGSGRPVRLALVHWGVWVGSSTHT